MSLHEGSSGFPMAAWVRDERVHREFFAVKLDAGPEVASVWRRSRIRIRGPRCSFQPILCSPRGNPVDMTPWYSDGQCAMKGPAL